MVRRQPHTLVALPLFGGVLFCLISAALLYYLLALADRPETVPAVPDEEVPGNVEEAVRSYPVAGLPGHQLLVYPDGSSYLDAGDGMVPRMVTPPRVPVSTSPEPVAAPAVRVIPKKGQLVMCERGAVNVPADATITLIGKDRVVTIQPADGASTTYYVDGRVERRDRIPREAGK